MAACNTNGIGEIAYDENGVAIGIVVGWRGKIPVIDMFDDYVPCDWLPDEMDEIL